MIDPFAIATSGLKTASVCLTGYAAIKLLFPFDYTQLMDTTFNRSKLFVTVSERKDKKELRPKLVSFLKMDWGFEFKYQLLPGMTVQQFIEKKSYVDTAFNAESFIYSKNPGEITIDVMRMPLPEIEYFNLEKIEPFTEGMAIPLPIGMTRKGMEVIDLAKVPHGCLGGESGGGKSVFVRQFLASLALLRTPEQVLMTLIDLKQGVELSMFEKLPHVMGFAKDISDVDETLSKVNSILDERGKAFSKAGVVNIIEHNRKFKPIPHHLVLVDELAEVEDTTLIQRIARLGRAYGVHLLLCSQRLSAEVLTGAIKANLPLSICFQVKNGVNSRIILDNENAKYLPPIPGRAIIQYKGERQFQTMFLDEDRARTLIKVVSKRPLSNKEGESNHGSEREGNKHLNNYF